MSDLLTQLFYYTPSTVYTDDMFQEMWSCDKIQFLQIVFYLRHHRADSKFAFHHPVSIPTLKQSLQKVVGRGQRKIFYQVIRWMSYHHLSDLVPLIPYIPDHGYWKDLLMLLGTPAEDHVIELFACQLQLDYDSYHQPVPGLISLASKWTPNENSSFDRKHKVYTNIARRMKLSKKELRTRYLVPLRKYLNVTEQIITNQEWSTINYNLVPNRSMQLHRRTFEAHDSVRYKKHVDRTNIKVSDCFELPPLVKSVLRKSENRIAPPPDAATSSRSSALYAVDVSGAMMGLPIALGSCLCIESGTDTWIPYRFEGETCSTMYAVTGSTYLDKINAITDIPKRNPYSGTDIQTCVDLFLGTTKQHLIIVTNTLLDPIELPSVDPDRYITYWSIHLGPITITAGQNYSLIEGYDINIYLELRDGNIVTPDNYRDLILEASSRTNNIPSL